MTTLRITPQIAFLMFLAGCATTHSGTRGLTIDEVVKDLHSQGLDMVETDRAVHSYFSAPGHGFAVAGGEIQIYVYKSDGAATLDASKIRRGSMDVESPPHYYQRDNVLAVYSGNNMSVKNVLTEVLGSPIR